jgi:hypothetical protein
VVTLPAMRALTEGVWSVAQIQATGQTPASSRPVLLKEGTEIKLKLHDKITSKTAVEGDLVNLIFKQDVRVGDITVARAGSVAVATVSHAAKAGMLGRPGDLRLRLEYLRADDSSVRLRGTKGKQGKSKRGDGGCAHRSFWTHWANQARQERSVRGSNAASGLGRSRHYATSPRIRPLKEVLEEDLWNWSLD